VLICENTRVTEQTTAPARSARQVGYGWFPRFSRALVRWILERLFKFDLVGLEHVPAGRYIAAANHPSWLETFILVAFLPAERGLRMLASHRQTTAIGWRRPLLEWADAVLPLDLDNGEVLSSVRGAVELLKGGSAIGIFPEDLTDPTPPDGSLRPLRRGVAFLARAGRSPVVPIAVPDTRELWRGRRIRVAIGEPLPPPTSKAEEELFLARLGERIEALRPRPEPLPAKRPWRWLSRLF
jgi:1-acyl-sn-glycerol-3-phosphate acyltransferase